MLVPGNGAKNGQVLSLYNNKYLFEKNIIFVYRMGRVEFSGIEKNSSLQKFRAFGEFL